MATDYDDVIDTLQECEGLLREYEVEDDEIFIRIRRALETLGYYEGNTHEEHEDQSYG